MCSSRALEQSKLGRQDGLSGWVRLLWGVPKSSFAGCRMQATPQAGFTSGAERFRHLLGVHEEVVRTVDAAASALPGDGSLQAFSAGATSRCGCTVRAPVQSAS